MRYLIVGELDGKRVFWRDCGNRAADISAWDTTPNRGYDGEDGYEYLQRTITDRLPDKLNYADGGPIHTLPTNLHIEPVIS